MPLKPGPAPATTAGNRSSFEYPPEEWRVVRQLVRLIGSAPTWQNVVEASDALFHVEQMAKSLRSEYKGMTASSSLGAAGSPGGEMAYPRAVPEPYPDDNETDSEVKPVDNEQYRDLLVKHSGPVFKATHFAGNSVAVQQHLNAIAEAVKIERERCAHIALAIDGGRGNEKEIVRAIREQSN